MDRGRRDGVRGAGRQSRLHQGVLARARVGDGAGVRRCEGGGGGGGFFGRGMLSEPGALPSFFYVIALGRPLHLTFRLDTM